MIARFSGAYHFLSNFYPSPIMFDGTYYVSVEHYFQSHKTKDEAGRAAIIAAFSPREAKRLGRTVVLRPDWDVIKFEVMRRGLSLKFADRTGLAYALLATGDQLLVEGNTWGDKFWGVPYGPDDTPQLGLNWLGHLLMARRAELRAT